jgi:hypothetical protein
MPGAPASVTQVRGGSLRSVAVLQELIALSRERDSRAGPSRDLCWFWMDACAPAPTARYCGQPLPASRAAQPWSLRVRAWGAATCSWALCGDAGGEIKPPARTARHVRFCADCVAKLFGSRSQGSVLSAGSSLVALPGVGAALLDATLTQGRPLPKVAGHGREAWRAA